jgi:Chalcone isomerase-like
MTPMRRLLPYLRSITAVLVVVAATAALVAPAHASTLPQPVLQADYKLQRVGAGDLKWLGRPIYAASLWTAHGEFSGYMAGEPVALSLWYQREFSRDALLRITSTAWRMLDAVPLERRERWLTELSSFWSDVRPGDNVTTVVVPGKATRFYDERGLMGQIDDPDFGPAFLSIWLDSRSVVGDLRVKLLGLERGTARR